MPLHLSESPPLTARLIRPRTMPRDFGAATNTTTTGVTHLASGEVANHWHKVTCRLG